MLTLPRRFVLAVLGVIYGIAFVLSPYWMLPAAWAARALVLGIILTTGAAWLAASAGKLQLRFSVRGIAEAITLTVALGFLDYKALSADIPWRGDEAAHIARTQLVASWIPAPLFAAGAVLAVLLLAAAWRSGRLGIGTGAIALAGVITLVATNPRLQGPDVQWITHYPLLNYWAYAVPVELAGPISGIYHEALYRVVPFLSMAGVAWLIQREFAGGHAAERVLWALAAATIPILAYYSSVLYVEPLAVLLMVFVSLRSRDLVTGPPERLKSMPAWYALLLIGLIRDTTLLFILCLLAWRVVHQWSQRPDGARVKAYVREEAGVAAAALLPYALFMGLKYTLTGSDRGYAPSLAVLSDASVYRAVGQSWVEQFGPWLVLFAIGGVLLWKQREKGLLGFLTAVLLIYPAFHALDSHGQYAGYSRFNLFMAGPIIAGAIAAARAIRLRGARLSALAASGLIALNLLLSPVHLDGSKTPLWGTFFRDTAEHYYPYAEAMTWLKENAAGQRILFSGMDYGYSFDFYFQKLGWTPRRQVKQVSYTGNAEEEFQMVFPWGRAHPERRLDVLWESGGVPSESEQLASVLRSGTEGKFGAVVYQVLGDSLPHPADSTGYVLAKIFRNEAHTLMIYLSKP